MNLVTNNRRCERWQLNCFADVTAIIKRGCRVLLLLMGLSVRASDLLPPMTNGVPMEFAPRRAGSEVGADRRIHVDQEGLYRITHQSLLAAGITNPVGAELRLFCRTQEIALAVSSDDVWTTNDFAVFYGWPHDGYWTITNTYWLGFGGAGLRMTTRNAAPQPGWPEQTSHWRTVHFENKVLFIPTYRPMDAAFDHWITMNVFSNATNVFISSPDRVPSGSAVVYLALWGRSSSAAHDPDHATRFSINAQGVQTSRFDGMTFHLATNIFPQSALSNGLNTIQLRQTFTGATDVASLEWLTLEYEASNRVANGRLSFAGRPISNNYTAAPWNTNEVPWLLDISNPFRPVKLANFTMDSSGATGRVRWANFALGTNRFWLASPTTLIDVAVSPPVLFHDLATTSRQVDYVFITHSTLSTGAYQLAKHRARDGMRTLMVSIDSVYDEFSYGIKDARAIKQFIGYAYHHWAGPPPRYALLVGDGSYDPQNRQKATNLNERIPVWMGPAAFEYCAQDGWFATVDGSDYLRDVKIGRLPFATHALVTGAITRLINFESASNSAVWRTRALCVADTNGPPNSFQTMSDTHILTNLLKAGVPTYRRAHFDGANSVAVLNTITNTINGTHTNGPVFSVSYFGHGWFNDWAVGFNNGHVAALSNSGSQPFFTVWTCANGAFANPTNQSMSERLLERPYNRGASAVFSASGLSVNEAARRLADGFFKLFTNAAPRLRIGDAIDAGCLELFAFSTNSEEMLFYNLFGDPAQVVKP